MYVRNGRVMGFKSATLDWRYANPEPRTAVRRVITPDSVSCSWSTQHVCQ